MPGLVIFTLFLQFAAADFRRELKETSCLDTAETDCTACKSGSYLDVNKCFECPSNCAECTSEKTCTSCPSGSFLNQENCTTCPNNCKTCESSSNCTSCDRGFYHNTGKCSSCSSKCSECSDLSSCSSCSKGFYLENVSCIECPSGCIQCSSSSLCSSCQERYYFKENSCKECSSFCNQCNETTCLQCDEGSYFNDGECFECDEKPLKAVIRGPTEYSIFCDGIVFDGSYSVFNPEQPVDFNWTVEQVDKEGGLISSDEFFEQEISPQISNISSVLIVNLTIGICGKKSFTQLITEIKLEKGVLLVPYFGNHVKVAYEKEVLLNSGDVNRCGLTGDLKWSWSGELEATGKTLTISGLPAGLYNESLKVLISNSVTFFNFSLEITPPPVIVVLSRSSGVASSEEDFLINGSESSGLVITKYEWTCFNSTSKKKCLNQTGDELNPGNEESFLIGKELLVKNGNLTISLKVKTSDQVASLSVEVLFGDFEDVSVKQSTKRLNPAQDFYLKTTGETSGKVLWKSSIDLPTNNLLSLWIPAGSLKNGASYMLRLLIDQVEYANLFLKTSELPFCDSTFKLSSSSGDFGSGVSVFSPSCSSSEDYPLSFTLNYSTPSYFNLTLKTLLPVGFSNLTLSICDSLDSCQEQNSQVSISFEKLSDKEILQKYSEFTKTTDMIPMTVISLALSTAIPEDLFKTMLSDLETYFNTFKDPQIAVVNGLAALTSSAQPDSSLASNYAKIISMIEDVNITHFNSKLQLFYTVQIYSNLARLKSSSKLEDSSKVFLESMKKITKNYGPGQYFEVSNADFSFFKVTKLGNEFSGFFYQSAGRNISFPSNLPLDSSSLMNFYYILYKNKGNYSDFLEISFTKSGEISNNSLTQTSETLVKLSRLSKPITISLNYRKNVNNKWACAYLQDSEWHSSGCQFLKNDSKSIRFTTNHTSLFSLFDTSEVKLPPVQYIESSSGCGENLNGIWVLIVIIFLYIIFFPVLWYFDKADLKEVMRNNNYDNIKKCDSDPSIASPSFSEEMPSNNLSSDYAIQYKPKPQKLRKHSCKVLIEGHLVFGLPVFRTEFTRVLRISTFAVVLIFELLLEGLLMMGFEDTDSGSSGDAKKYFEDYRDKYFGYTIFALVISLLVQVSLIILFSLKGKMRRFGIAAGLALMFVVLIGSIAGIIIMAVKFCPNWSGYWGISFLFGTIVEVGLVQTAVMFSRWGLLKCFE